MSEELQVYRGALQAIRKVCQEAKDEEAALRKIEQIVGFAFQRAGEELPGIEHKPDGPEEVGRYLIDLGAFQMDAQRRVWLNDSEVRCEGFRLTVGDGPDSVDLIGVQCGEQADAPAGAA